MISFGPLALPIVPLLLAAALIVSVTVGTRAASSHRSDIENALYVIMLGGILAARAAFVAWYWDLYRTTPLGIFDIRDGGFSPWAGALAAAGLASAYLIRNRLPRRAMQWALAAGMLTLAIGGVAAWAFQRPMATVGLPARSFGTLDGKSLRLDALRGKPVVINLWASWCPPCRREMPALARAQADHGDIVFVFANQGETAADVKQYLAAQHIDIANVILDGTGDIARHVAAPGLPTTLFFDREGRLVQVREGELSAASLAPHLTAIRASAAQHGNAPHLN